MAGRLNGAAGEAGKSQSPQKNLRVSGGTKGCLANGFAEHLLPPRMPAASRPPVSSPTPPVRPSVFRLRARHAHILPPPLREAISVHEWFKNWGAEETLGCYLTYLDQPVASRHGNCESL